ncbi:UDP-N-acetylmuramate dehydrogenase [Pseudomonas sp. HR96]|uniref:UDP-N-acetylmuramate dehydrogenase n=1 Tax=Pseudomonas sp. HR96 TaxID=1027966 RepID=UPI002A7481D2|nr:UDP-N-acetylmuramate dehydrogenase [Pseudomonas sp. HR96]WPO98767.1 UDP-N-acetylmuramate dehydrogenase [Pseudomonas sp. HR96]
MSLQLQPDVSLKPFNTFGIDVRADWLVQASSQAQIVEALAVAQARQWPVLVIGGGSNLLLAGDIPGLVLRVATRGIRLLDDDGERVVVEAEAGEPWHGFVLHTLGLGLAGLENLSLIPGTVGAAPMQNIGAYGVEIQDLFAGLTALDRHSGETRQFSLQDCRFGYRDSVFKQEPGRWLILRVRFALQRTAHLRLDYGPVRQRLAELGIAEPTASDVSAAICSIRREKLPDPAELGNAGSFFKNPLVDAAQAEALRLDYPGLVAYPQADGRVKLAAGWLIEQAGWKGHRKGDAGVHRLQSLVLVNYGQASGAQIQQLAQAIQADILRRFGVQLEMEPNLYPQQ